MGCGSSKEKVCRNCQAPYIPVRRTFSVQVRHPSHDAGDNYHLVSLTSSTLGSLNLDPSIHPNRDEGEGLLVRNHCVVEDRAQIRKGRIDSGKVGAEEFVMGMIEAKTWSKMIDEKIPKIVPKTPVRTPPGEPEMINAWEMMEGLEDISPLSTGNHFRSFSFHVPCSSGFSTISDHPTPRLKENGIVSPKPLWLDLADSDSNSNDTSIVSEFDPDVIATFRKSLEELPPSNPFCLKSVDCEKQQTLAEKGCALELIDEMNSNKAIVPLRKDKLVVYFTSLRGVRKTYEDCCHVRVILKGLGVKVDERDVSMHSRFKDELKELLKEGCGVGGLPRVFMGNTYIGGADEIRRLNDEEKLGNVVENCELVNDGRGGGGSGNACEACGDIRFVPCEVCSGSCKIYYEEDYDEEEYEENEHEYGFRRCPDCNENGLIRCPICCD